MPTEIVTFLPEKRSIGQILSNTSPPIRVPDFQRDFSWDHEQVSEFWSDLIAFGAGNLQKMAGKEYFLGAAVLVNNGSYHLLLDGRQRLATATILLVALRDQIREFNENAANQIQDRYVEFTDLLTGARVFKIELNVFDRAFFRDFIQSFPRLEGAKAAKRSHQLIRKAYEYFKERIAEGWQAAGGGKKGFEWAAHVTETLRENMVLVTVTSTDERGAASIFATLNDRGIGLSTVDLVRSYTLQMSHPTEREEILQAWDQMFVACGTTDAAETVLRMSWVSQHGDVKTRSLYKVVSAEVPEKLSTLDFSRRLRDDAVLFRQFRDGDSEDPDLQELWLALRALKFAAGYPLLFSASHKLSSGAQKSLARALVALVVRHNIVSNLDRAKLESRAYAVAKKVADGASPEAALDDLRQLSPSKDQFEITFRSPHF